MNARASAIQGKKLSGERIANHEKMSECPALDSSSTRLQSISGSVILGKVSQERPTSVSRNRDKRDCFGRKSESLKIKYDDSPV
jgi:hypothetical protein